jgi:hypothetical protein
MTFQELRDGVPTTFKIIGLHDKYEFWCKECSYKHLYRASKKIVRQAFWNSSWQIELSETLEKHQLWHEQHLNESWEEHEKQKLDETSRQAMQEINRMFRSFFR